METSGNRISITGLSLAVATVAVVCYGLCLLILSTIGTEKTNQLLFPLLSSPSDKANIWQQMSPEYILTGFILIFIFGWFMGAIIAAAYNTYIERMEKSGRTSENKK